MKVADNFAKVPWRGLYPTLLLIGIFFNSGCAASGNVTNGGSSTQTYSLSGTLTPAAGGGGAMVKLSGGSSASTTADSSGNFSFTGLANGPYTVTPSNAGYTFTPASENATINGANATGINFTASAQAAQTFSISGAITPAAGGGGASVALSGSIAANTTANGSGNYSFMNLTNGNYAVTPSNTGYTFFPLSQAVPIKGASASGINFTATPVYTISGTITPATAGSGALVTLSGSASNTTSANASGSYSFTGLSSGSYTVTPSSQSATFSPTSQNVTITNASDTSVNFSATATAKVIFFDDFTGTSLSSAWTVISRHGEYAQSETECNIPQEVSVADSILTIATSVGPATCGDFNVDGSVRHAPSSWPYITGDVQWTSFNFTYGTISVYAQFPSVSTKTWPAIWMLTTLCQITNPFTADTGYDTCPALLASNYFEFDVVECFQENWCQSNIIIGGTNHNCEYQVDTNFHLFAFSWTSSEIVVSIDGVTACSFNSDTLAGPVPSVPMFLIMQTQTGEGSPYGPPDNSLLPTQFNIDYVKVTQP